MPFSSQSCGSCCPQSRCPLIKTPTTKVLSRAGKVMTCKKSEHCGLSSVPHSGQPNRQSRQTHPCSDLRNSTHTHALDGRNRAIVVAESLARVIVAIRIASVRWRSYLPPKHSHRPCVRCAAIRIARLAFIRVVFIPRGTAEWPARVDRVG